MPLARRGARPMAMPTLHLRFANRVVGLAFSLALGCSTPAGHGAPPVSPNAVEAMRSAQARTAAPASFAGDWRTTYGRMRIEVDGNHATGTYSHGAGGKFQGIVDGDVLRVVYEEPGGVRGRARFALAADGSGFRGVWLAGVEDDAQLDAGRSSAWEGTRIVVVEGRVWLVVLEAYWQEGLHEPDYSYGEMLGAFFERLPDVQFRQRFFSSPSEFERLVEECAQLAEPVVLYLSTHGSPEGLASPHGLITGDLIGRSVARIHDLKLLHLGACEALVGDLPRSIRAAAGERACFPVSGFTRKVDWAGSALVDFTYLDLVLERGLDPASAVDQTRRLVAFASSTTAEDAAIPATDLTISLP